ncbi:MAG TPA: hypothetical protein VGK36_10070 [Candidatus Angelobacter sp.]|jgi:hypothetical protein
MLPPLSASLSLGIVTRLADWILKMTLDAHYEEAFEWSLWIQKKLSSDGNEALYARPNSYQIIGSTTGSEGVVNIDIKMEYPRNALLDWWGQRSVKTLLARVTFEGGKLKSQLARSVLASTRNGSLYSDIVYLTVKIFPESVELYSAIHK